MAYRLTPEQARTCIAKIRAAIQNYFQQYNLTYAIFGKSEGLDSSVIAGLLSDLPGIRPIGVLMPCESDPEAERIGRLVLSHFAIPTIKVDLTTAFHTVMSCFYSSSGLQDQLLTIVRQYGDQALTAKLAARKARAAGNIKARLRMITLYHIAQLTGGVVISTDNLSEMWMGFWTINGDVGDLAPIQHVFKGLEEYVLAKELGVPPESLQAVPTDGLDIIPGGTDEDQLGLPYQDLDRVIIRLLQNQFNGTSRWSTQQTQDLIARIAEETGYPNQAVLHVASQLAATNYKRQWPAVISREQAGLTPVSQLNVLD